MTIWDCTDEQAVSGQAVTLNVPGMSRDLGLTQLQAQWVGPVPIAEGRPCAHHL
jgi:hypothetical protein